MIKKASLTLLIGLLIVGSSAFADSADDVQCTMITVVRPVLPMNQTLITKDDVNHVLPTNMTPGTNATLFAAQLQSGVEQKMATNILEGDLFRSSALGKATTKVESLSKATVAAGTNSSGQKVNIEFNLKVPERQAVITYKGTINSEIVYTVDQSSFKWTLSRLINKTTTIAWTNIATPSTNTASSMLSLTHSF